MKELLIKRLEALEDKEKSIGLSVLEKAQKFRLQLKLENVDVDDLQHSLENKKFKGIINKLHESRNEG